MGRGVSEQRITRGGMLFAPSRGTHVARQDARLIIRSIVTDASSVGDVGSAFLFGDDRVRQSAVAAFTSKVETDSWSAEALITWFESDEHRYQRLHDMIDEEFEEQPLSQLSLLLMPVIKTAYELVGHEARDAFNSLRSAYDIGQMGLLSRNAERAIISDTNKLVFNEDGVRHWLGEAHAGIERLRFSTFLRVARSEATDVLLTATAQFCQHGFVHVVTSMLGRGLTRRERLVLRVDNLGRITAGSKRGRELQELLQPVLIVYYDGVMASLSVDDLMTAVRERMEIVLAAAVGA
jgi:hypothetical protein